MEYARIAEDVPEALDIYKEEEEHERELIAMVDDCLLYTSRCV